MTTEKNQNPFKVDDYVNLDAVGGRRTSSSPFKGKLIEALRDLPVDPNKSIKIGKELIGSRNSATTLISQIKLHLRETYPQLKDAEYTTRSFTDANEKYDHIRVWRTY